MTIFKGLIFGACIAAFSASLAAQTARDQGAIATTSADQLEEVIVTAQRRAERLQDIPVAASVVTGAQLASQELPDLESVAMRLPDVKIAEGTVDTLVIRGVGSGANYGFEQAVGTFEDGVYIGRARAVHAALFDIDQVEVLKGPQSIFFGNNTIAGALNITTRKPGQDFEYNGDAYYGWNIGEYAVEGGVTTPITNNLSVRVAAKAFGEDGYVDNVTLGRDEPHQRNWIGRVSLAWEPTADWRVDLRVDHDANRQHGDGAVLLGCPRSAAYGPPTGGGECSQQLAATGGAQETSLDNKSYNSTASFEDYNMTSVALTNRWNFGGYALTSISSYFNHNDVDFPTTAPFAFAGVGGIQPAVAAEFDESYHDYAEELRFESPTDQRVSYMIGAYFDAEKLNVPEYFGFYFVPFGLFTGPPYTANTPVASFVSFDQETKTYSAFGSATWHVTDALRVNAGLRYSSIDKTAHSITSFGTAGGVPSGSNYIVGPASVNAVLASPFFLNADLGDFPDTSRRDSQAMPSAGIQYDLTPDVMSYFTFATGFKAGGFGTSFGRNTFKPEYADDFELGLKSSWLNHTLVADVALFFTKYRNLQENTSIIVGGIPQNLIENAARAESKGVEASVDWRPVPMLVLNADVAYLHSRYTSYPDAPCNVLQIAQAAGGPCTQDLSGSVRAYAPDYSGSLSASLNVPVIDGLEVRVIPTLYFTSGFYETATIDSLLYQGGYAKLDTRIAIGPSNRHWEVAVVGKNLTDKMTAQYRNTAIDSGTYYALPDPPRTVGIQFSFKN